MFKAVHALFRFQQPAVRYRQHFPLPIVKPIPTIPIIIVIPVTITIPHNVRLPADVVVRPAMKIVTVPVVNIRIRDVLRVRLVVRVSIAFVIVTDV